MRLLQERKADPWLKVTSGWDEGKTARVLAKAEGWFGVQEILPANDETALHSCARTGAVDAALKLVLSGSVSARAQNEDRKTARDLAVQLRRWRGRKLERLGDRLMEMHRALLANNQSAELLLAQGLAEIARAAAPRR